MVLQFNLNDFYNYKIKKIIDFINEEYLIGIIRDYLDDYISYRLKNYRNIIKLKNIKHYYYDRNDLPIIIIEFDISKDISSNTINIINKILNKLQIDIYNLIKYSLKFISYIYYKFYNKIRYLQKEKFCNNIQLNSVNFYISNIKYGITNDYYFNNSILTLENSIFKDMKIDFNRLRLQFYLAIEPIEIDEIRQFMLDYDLRNLLIKGYQQITDPDNLDKLAKNLFIDIFRDKGNNFINIDKTNIKNYYISFNTYKSEYKPIYRYFIAIDIKYLNKLNFDLIQLDKIIDIFIELSKSLYLHPVINAL